jgi:hypothetical protein
MGALPRAWADQGGEGTGPQDGCGWRGRAGLREGVRLGKLGRALWGWAGGGGGGGPGGGGVGGGGGEARVHARGGEAGARLLGQER